VIGGLITSTFLSLLVVPTLYLAIARRSKGKFISRRRVPETEPGSVEEHVPVLS